MVVVYPWQLHASFLRRRTGFSFRACEVFNGHSDSEANCLQRFPIKYHSTGTNISQPASLLQKRSSVWKEHTV